MTTKRDIRDLNPTYLNSQGSELLLSRHYSLMVNVEQGQTLKLPLSMLLSVLHDGPSLLVFSL
jgi:hypothetical protein